MSLNLGPKSSVQDWQTPSYFFWASVATSIPNISLYVVATDKRECHERTVTKGLQHAAIISKSYALYSVYMHITLCKIYSLIVLFIFLEYQS